MITTKALSRRGARWLTILLMLGLSACATSSDAKKAITKFASATETATAAMKEYDEAVSTRVTTLIRAQAVANPRSVAVPDEDCSTTSKECKVVYKSVKDDPSPKALTVTSLIPSHVAAATAIAQYAAALQEVVDASAQEQVGAALDKAASAVASLAATLNPESAPAAKAIVGPTGQAFAWLYGKYEDNLKLDALRSATSEMDKVIQEAATEFGTVTSFAKLAGLAFDADSVEKAREAFEENPSDATLVELITQTTALNTALSAPASTVFADVAKAHGKLTKALVDRPDSLVEIFAALDDLGKDAEKLYEIAKAFKKATADASTGGGEGQ